MSPSPSTATIIPFPARHSVTEVQPDPGVEDAQERLRRALVSLNAALAVQHEAVAGWRGALGTLRTSVQDLQTSLQSYNSRLGTLGDRVGHLNTEAKKMEAWADGVLQTSA